MLDSHSVERPWKRHFRPLPAEEPAYAPRPPSLRPRKNTHHPAAEYNGAPHPSLCRGRTQPRPSVFSGANMGAFTHSPELPMGHAAAFRSIYARTVHATSIAPMLPQKRSYPGRISIPDTGFSEIRFSSSGQKDAVAVVEEVGVVVRGEVECGGEAQVIHALFEKSHRRGRVLHRLVQGDCHYLLDAPHLSVYMSFTTAALTARSTSSAYAPGRVKVGFSP